MEPVAEIRPKPWQAAPNILKIDQDEIHIWLINLNESKSEINQIASLLSMDEFLRMERFRRKERRDSFAIVHGALHMILGNYLHVSPERINFKYDYHSKPTISPVTNNLNLDFNLSHSAEYAVIGIARNRRIGVDLELISTDRLSGRIPERFFSLREVRSLRSLPEKLQLKAFFACWTRKEAYLKARGSGLSLPLAEFTVSLAPGETPALLEMKSDPTEMARWSLIDLELPVGYCGAAAVEGRKYSVKYYHYK